MTKNRTSKVVLDSAGNARGSWYVDCKNVRASHGSNYDCREKNGKMSTVVTQLLADYIVTAELEGDRVMGNARRRNKNVL